jgi:hypothetical protein
MPLEVYEKVRDELPYSVGVLCPEKLGYKFLQFRKPLRRCWSVHYLSVSPAFLAFLFATAHIWAA